VTRLLVSVRNAHEASAALAGGADVIDVKEPSRGALGSADPSVWRSVVTLVAGKAPVSVALGELCDFADCAGEIDFAAGLAGVRWAKVGLAGLGRTSDWRDQWRLALDRLPPTVQAVAVVYVDHHSADAPQPEAIVEAASLAGLSMVLFDTFDKSKGHLLDHLPLATLHPIVVRARASGMRLALAGSLRHAQLGAVGQCAPDFIAVRGAVCAGDRESAVDEHLVRRLSIAVRNLRLQLPQVASAKA
jgi:uncharacterized protein (UPF0264 family)